MSRASSTTLTSQNPDRPRIQTTGRYGHCQPCWNSSGTGFGSAEKGGICSIQRDHVSRRGTGGQGRVDRSRALLWLDRELSLRVGRTFSPPDFFAPKISEYQYTDNLYRVVEKRGVRLRVRPGKLQAARVVVESTIILFNFLVATNEQPFTITSLNTGDCYLARQKGTQVLVRL